MTDTSAEGTNLSAEEIDELRREVRAAAALSRAELAAVCSRYMRGFAISYRQLRQIADVPLPDHSAGVKNGGGQVTRRTKPPLSAEQTALLIEAYRDLVSKSGPPAPPRKFVEESARRFGVWIFMIKKALSADERANRELYSELRAAGKRRAAEEAQRKAEQKPRQEGASGKPRRKAGKRRGSVWTVGGGLPGMGRRS